MEANKEKETQTYERTQEPSRCSWKLRSATEIKRHPERKYGCGQMWIEAQARKADVSGSLMAAVSSLCSLLPSQDFSFFKWLIHCLCRTVLPFLSKDLWMLDDGIWILPWNHYLEFVCLVLVKFFPGGSEERICLQGGSPGFSPWVGKIPWRRTWQPTPVFLPRESPWTEEPGRLQSMESQKSWTRLSD